MRILITTDPIGGVWTFTKELSNELLHSGCSVALVSLGRIPGPAQLDWVAAQVAEWGSKFRFAACDAPLESMQDNWNAIQEAEPLLNRVASEFRADLLISSQYCFGAFKADLPRIIVAHSDMFSWAKACRRGPLPDSDWLDRYTELVDNGLRQADAVVAPSQWMLDQLAGNFKLPETARVIPSGRTMPNSWRNTDRFLQAIAAGPLWDEGKNLSLLGEVDSPIPMLVAGETEHEYAQLGHSCGQATLLGPLDEERLFTLFRQSSIYVCTSLYESFGFTPLEAALCGCAVIANDIPTLREVWGDAGLFFKDASSLSQLLGALAEDSNALARARSRARRRAQQLSARKMAKSYLDVIHTVVEPAIGERSAA